MILVVSAKQFQLNEQQFRRLYDIIITAYAETEKELWGEGYVRVTEEAFQHHVESDEIQIALLDGKIVGGVRIFQLAEKIWSFSLLGADFKEKGKGIGRKLISEVERICREKGGERIRIEVLRPETAKVQSKEIIKDWYQRQGYDIVKSIGLAELYPEKAPNLLTPGVFDCYEKIL